MYPQFQFVGIELTEVRHQLTTKRCFMLFGCPQRGTSVYICGASGSQISDICGTVLAALVLCGLFLSRQEGKDGV